MTTKPRLMMSIAALSAFASLGYAATATPTLEHARDEYVHGNYAKSISIARTFVATPSEQEAWRLIGADSCFLHDAGTVHESLAHLDHKGQQFVRWVCKKNDVPPWLPNAD